MGVLIFITPACSDPDSADATNESEELAGTVRLVCDEPAFVACGGDVEGEWDLQNGCFRGENVSIPDAENGACAIRDIVMNLQVDGDLQFSGDGSFSYALAMDGTAVLRMAPACLAATDGCSSLESSLRVDGLTCTGVAALGCDCAMKMTREGEQEKGHYESSGNALIFVYDDQVEPDAVNYCRRGDELLATIPWSDLPNAQVTLLFRKR